MAQRPRLDPQMRLQKTKALNEVRLLKHHHRSPDVGIGIVVLIPNETSMSSDIPNMIQYYGEYLGHGQSKTAFQLDCPGQRFHGKVLKVAREWDKEPIWTLDGNFLQNSIGGDISVA